MLGASALSSLPLSLIVCVFTLHSEKYWRKHEKFWLRGYKASWMESHIWKISGTNKEVPAPTIMHNFCCFITASKMVNWGVQWFSLMCVCLGYRWIYHFVHYWYTILYQCRCSQFQIKEGNTHLMTCVPGLLPCNYLKLFRNYCINSRVLKLVTKSDSYTERCI